MIQLAVRNEIQGVGSGAIVTLHPSPEYICRKFLYDDKGAQCIRGAGHGGICDAISGDHQVWGLAPDGAFGAISFAYTAKNSAEIVLTWARRQLPTFALAVASSEIGHRIDYIKGVSINVQDALDIFRRLGW